MSIWPTPAFSISFFSLPVRPLLPTATRKSEKYTLDFSIFILQNNNMYDTIIPDLTHMRKPFPSLPSRPAVKALKSSAADD